MNWHVLAFGLALGISYVLTPVVRRLAIALNVMDHPGERRVHTRPIPRWGGIAVYVAFTLTILLISQIGGKFYPEIKLDIRMIGIIVAGALLATAGMIDDMKELSAAVQALSIIGATVVLMGFGVSIQLITNPFGNPPIIWLKWASWPVTILWVFILTKSMDLMDGLDGLAAGIGAIASGFLAIMAYYKAQPAVALMSATLCGACIGFLRFNFNPAKIFMGTVGSQFIGFTLAAISIVGLFKVAAAFAIAIPVLVFGVPIFDAFFVVWRRFRERRPVHVADRTHLHHRLLEKGLTHKQVVLLIYILCCILGIVALTIILSCR
ncbi:MAG: MraY family glycosyltransferase [Armatimonadota bacterium]|nr:MraY family glycosyltransferase [Armatimonadota bacterium]